MQIIIITTVVITVIGICVGAGLVFTNKKFYVEVDERESAVREVLPAPAAMPDVTPWQRPSPPATLRLTAVP